MRHPVDVAQVGWMVLGAVIGFVISELLGRGVRSIDRTRVRNDPLTVHVETDPAIMWAGMPPWIGAGFLVPPESDVSDPPGHCPDWRSWAHARGGLDEALTQVRVTLMARESAAVVVDGLQVTVNSREPAPAWRRITCGVGGADITPRRAEVRLSDFATPLVTWLDEGGDSVNAPTFTLSGSEAEMIHVWAYVSDDERVEWTADLLVIVDGQRRRVHISDDGRPFVTVGGGAAVADHMWVAGGDAWDPPVLPPA